MDIHRGAGPEGEAHDALRWPRGAWKTGEPISDEDRRNIVVSLRLRALELRRGVVTGMPGGDMLADRADGMEALAERITRGFSLFIADRPTEAPGSPKEAQAPDTPANPTKPLTDDLGASAGQSGDRPPGYTVGYDPIYGQFRASDPKGQHVGLYDTLEAADRGCRMHWREWLFADRPGSALAHLRRLLVSAYGLDEIEQLEAMAGLRGPFSE